MENLTIGEITNILKFIIEFVGLLVTVVVTMKKILEKQFKPINEKVEKIEKIVNEKIDNLDLNQCKNFLVRFLADVERGQAIDEVEIKRAHDVYDHYKDDLHGNSYIKDKWEKLMK